MHSPLLICPWTNGWRRDDKLPCQVKWIKERESSTGHSSLENLKPFRPIYILSPGWLKGNRNKINISQVCQVKNTKPLYQITHWQFYFLSWQLILFSVFLLTSRVVLCRIYHSFFLSPSLQNMYLQLLLHLVEGPLHRQCPDLGLHFLSDPC